MNSFEQMEAVIAQRRAEPQEGSYTCYLFEKGIDKILKKVGEECAETIIAAKNGVKEDTVGEISDLIYHLTVMMVEQNIPVAFYYGDYIGEEFTDVPAAAMWSMMASSADTFTEAYNAAGGNSTVIHLPDEGITGNSHFMFQELNNDIIADHIEAWIQENVEQ